MGLIERGTSPLDEASKDSSSFRSSRRLPWFVARFRRPVQTAIQGLTAGVIGLAGAYGILPPTVNADSAPQIAGNVLMLSSKDNPQYIPPSSVSSFNPETDSQQISELTNWFVKEVKNSGIDPGARLTQAWKGLDGAEYVLFERYGFKRGADGFFTTWNMMDIASAYGLDAALARGVYGVEVPEQVNLGYTGGGVEQIFEQSVLGFGIPEDTAGYVRNNLRLTGIFTAYPKVNEQGTIYRTQTGLFSVPNDGSKPEIIPAGSMIVQTQLVPRETRLAVAVIDKDIIAADILLPLPDVAAGGGTTPSPQETAQLPSQLFETTPQGRLATEKFKEGEVGWKPRQESATKTDEFFNELNVKIIFKSNPQLRIAVGTYILKPCDTCNKTPESYGVLRGSVDPADPRTLIMEFNIFRLDFKLDPAWREQLGDIAAGAIGGELSKILYGKSSIDGLPQEQANHIGQLAHKLQYEIRPLELIAPTTG